MHCRVESKPKELESCHVFTVRKYQWMPEANCLISSLLLDSIFFCCQLIPYFLWQRSLNLKMPASWLVEFSTLPDRSIVCFVVVKLIHKMHAKEDFQACFFFFFFPNTGTSDSSSLNIFFPSKKQGQKSFLW